MIKEESWKMFQDSFLKGQERKSKFENIRNQVDNDLPTLLLEHANIDQDKIGMIAISGSVIYGPRRQGEFLSDVDVHFLTDENTDNKNFEIFPRVSDKTPYHLVGTGKSDEARGKRNKIHWLLYPHYPIINKYEDKELKGIISNIIEDTSKREDEIIAEISRLNEVIEKKSEPEIRD